MREVLFSDIVIKSYLLTSLVSIIILFFNRLELKTEIDYLKKRINCLEKRNSYYVETAASLREELRNSRQKSNNKDDIYKEDCKDYDDILIAIKVAMINSHPDKGGNSDDFIKFNKLYKKLK